VHKTSSHTSQAQFDGFVAEFDDLIRLLRACPLGKDYAMDIVSIARKLAGMVTDHASDQKLLAKLFVDWKRSSDRAQRGEDAASELTVQERVRWAVEALDHAASTTPGWNQLSDAEKDHLFILSWAALLLRQGDKKFENLTTEEKEDADLFLWHGCMMHKDLNATRGGDAAMKGAWEKHNLEPKPIPLKNKWEKAASASSDTRKPVEETYGCGGTKLTCLCGALFNHKDQSKGLHSTLRDWFEAEFGHAHVFPDTSNTRYGSHCEAAIELLVNRHQYVRFLGQLFDAKTKHGFTSLEENIYHALNDWSTLSELSTLALYSQTISRPYMAYVRSYEGNALDLGPFHERVLAHIRELIAHPEIALARDANPVKATLLGVGWERSDVIYWILSNMDQMPHLRILFVEFLTGALTTWERFAEEFAAGSAIAKSTGPQRLAAFSLPTNDISESAVGAAKQAILRNATITDTQRNSKAMRRFNGTEAWVKAHFTAADHAWCREEARRMDQSGEAARARTEQHRSFVTKAATNKVKREKLEAKRVVAKAKLAATVLERDPKKLLLFSSEQFGDMMNKWRETDKEVPYKSKLKKTDRYNAIIAAIEREKIVLEELVQNSVELADIEAGEGDDESDASEAAPDDEEMDG
jgi:hypothetical protein